MSVESLNCQCCGAPLNVAGTVCLCDYCGSTNIVCGDSGKYINQLNRANKLRQNCEFDRAFRVYDEILALNIPSADVLWSQTLCEYGIEYVQDPVTNRYLPTLHRIKDERIDNAPSFLEAIELADEVQKVQMISEAKEISRIQEEYLNIASSEKPYDVFICYKETDEETKKQTEDSGLALELYERLENYGYKVFFSRVTLQDKLGVNYEPYIFAALKSALVMVVVGTKPEYFNAIWVKNEWSRFLKLKENDKNKQMFFACDYVDDLPRAFSQRQAQLLTEPNAIQNLAYNIKNYVEKTRETEIVKKPVTGNCPNCNSMLKINDPNIEAALCPVCKAPFSMKEAIARANVKTLHNISPTMIETNIDKAKAFIKAADYEKAIEYINIVLAADPDNLAAKDMLRLLFFVRVSRTNPDDYERILEYLSKALEYDIDRRHLLITDYLCYLGSNAETNVLKPQDLSSVKGLVRNIKGFEYIPIWEYRKAKAYYSLAYSIHPENADITLAISRINYLLNEYVYFKTNSHGEDCELTATAIKVSKGLMKRTTEVYMMDGISNIQKKNLDENIYFDYNGMKKSIRVDVTEMKKFYEPFFNTKCGYCLKPNYEVLVKKNLIRNFKSSGFLTQKQYSIISYYDFNSLTKILEELKSY